MYVHVEYNGPCLFPHSNMTIQRILLGACSVLLLAGCDAYIRNDMSPEEKENAEKMMQEEADSMMKDEEDSMMKDDADGATVYTAYESGVIGNGETSVLFFKASWCPKCTAHDRLLKQWYADQEFPVSVYAVDFDNSLDLRSRYGVVQQHTFVMIDGEGNAVKTVNFPNDAGLQDFLLN